MWTNHHFSKQQHFWRHQTSLRNWNCGASPAAWDPIYSILPAQDGHLTTEASIMGWIGYWWALRISSFRQETLCCMVYQKSTLRWCWQWPAWIHHEISSQTLGMTPWMPQRLPGINSLHTPVVDQWSLWSVRKTIHHRRQTYWITSKTLSLISGFTLKKSATKLSAMRSNSLLWSSLLSGCPRK